MKHFKLKSQSQKKVSVASCVRCTTAKVCDLGARFTYFKCGTQRTTSSAGGGGERQLSTRRYAPQPKWAVMFRSHWEVSSWHWQDLLSGVLKFLPNSWFSIEVLSPDSREDDYFRPGKLLNVSPHPAPFPPLSWFLPQDQHYVRLSVFCTSALWECWSYFNSFSHVGPEEITDCEVSIKFYPYSPSCKRPTVIDWLQNSSMKQRIFRAHTEPGVFIKQTCRDKLNIIFATCKAASSTFLWSTCNTYQNVPACDWLTSSWPLNPVRQLPLELVNKCFFFLC